MIINQPDALSTIVRGLELKSDVYLNGDFCGQWAIDTSGSRRVPFHYINEGQAFLFDQEEEPTELNEGDLVLFPKDTPHILSNTKARPDLAAINQPFDENAPGPRTNLLCGFFEFKSKLAWPLLDKLDDTIVLSLKPESTHLIVKSIISEIKLRHPGWRIVLDELAYILFIHVLRSQYNNNLNEDLLGALFHPKMGQALSLIHERPGESWTIEKLAMQLGMSRSSFAEQFKNKVGMSVMGYITEWRMREATHLLMHTRRSISQIAEECGYRSEVSFRKAYKKVKGETPGQVRKSSMK